jgi:predicted RNase H-like HicB family nuclease
MEVVLMSKYIYPAIFTKDEEGYIVFFPDLEKCYTQGDTLEEAMERAKDVLSLVLYEYERKQGLIPEPTPIKQIETKECEIVSLVMGDTLEYRKRYNNKSVKKTLTIPAWLNEEASALDVNFSQVLQEALMKILNIRTK